MKNFGNIDSKFRFVILASKRAKQLIRGAKPKIKTKSKSPIRIAQNELKAGALEYEILKSKKDEAFEEEEKVFVSEELDEGIEGSEEEVHEEAGEVEEEEIEKDLEEEGEGLEEEEEQ